MRKALYCTLFLVLGILSACSGEVDNSLDVENAGSDSKADMETVVETLIEGLETHGFVTDHTTSSEYARLSEYYDQFTDNMVTPNEIEVLNLKDHFVHRVQYQLYRGLSQISNVFKFDIEENEPFINNATEHIIFTNDDYVYYQETYSYEDNLRVTIVRAKDLGDKIVIDYFFGSESDGEFDIMYYAYDGEQYDRLNMFYREPNFLGDNNMRGMENFHQDYYNIAEDVYESNSYNIDEDQEGNKTVSTVEYEYYDFANNDLIAIQKNGPRYERQTYGKLSEDAASVIYHTQRFEDLDNGGFGPDSYSISYSAKDVIGYDYASFTPTSLTFYDQSETVLGITDSDNSLIASTYNYYMIVNSEVAIYTQTDFAEINEYLSYERYTLEELSDVELAMIEIFDNTTVSDTEIVINDNVYQRGMEHSDYLEFLPQALQTLYNEINSN